MGGAGCLNVNARIHREMSRVLAGFAVFAAVTGVTAATSPVSARFVSADSAYYPRILEAVKSVSPDARREMLKSWSQQTSDGFVSPVGLHLFLTRFGYCSNLGGLMSGAGCKRLPLGLEAQGIAKDELMNLVQQERR